MDDCLSRVDVAPPESCLRSKDSRAVRRGAVGEVPAQVTRRPPTLPHVRFLAWMPTEGKLANKNDSSHPKPSCIPVLVSDFTPCSAEVPG